MALWIRVVDETAVTQSVTPRNSKRFTLEELQAFVGGYIEAVYLRDGRIMFVNEEGKLKELAYNPVADLMAHANGLPWHDSIVGDVVVLTSAEAGEDEDEDED